MSIRLLVVDDHEWIREGLRYAFQDTEIEIVAEAKTVAEAICEVAAEDNIDVVLMDIRMPDGDGFDALSRIKKTNKRLPVLIYASYDRSSFVRCSQLLGASGCLRKGVDRQTLIAAVRDAFMGKDVWDLASMATQVAP